MNSPTIEHLLVPFPTLGQLIDFCLCGDPDFEQFDEQWNTDMDAFYAPQAPAFLHATSFAATFLSRAPLDLSRETWILRYCSNALACALETPPSLDEETLIQIRRFWIPAAAILVSIAGGRLYRLSWGAENEISFAAGALWHGGNGVSAKRWVFWRERFRVLEEMEEIGAEGRGQAREAAERMVELEMSNE